MSPLPIVLILISCVSHASWNLLARRRRDEVAFFRRMLIMAVPLSVPVIGIGLLLPHSFPLKAWLCVIPSGIISGFYFRFLGLAYESGDFSVVYPVARALPVLVVAGFDVLRGRCPTPAGWIGMAVVAAGCVLAPQTSYRQMALRHYTSRTLLWIVLTAGTIVGFTAFDKMGAEAVRQGPGSAAIYCAIYLMTACATYLVLDRRQVESSELRVESGRQRKVESCQLRVQSERQRRNCRSVFHSQLSTGNSQLSVWALPAVAAGLSLVSYTLVIWAFQLSPYAGYLLAFRQFSIVIGVAVALTAYGERGWAVRVPATLAITAGLVLLALWG